MSAEFVPPEVQGWGTDTPPAPRMGYAQQTCDRCAGAWGPTRCSNAGCNSTEFTTTIIQPVPVLRGIMDRFRPKKTLHATAPQIKALRNLQASATALLAEIRALDVQLREAVVKDVDELQPSQGVVHQALSIEGDASWDRIPGLSLSLTAFAASLSRAIDHIEVPAK
jgi:hypothetical protein